MGCLPEIQDELTWLPVDVSARASVEAASKMVQVPGTEDMQVYHDVNYVQPAATWSAMITWLKTKETFEVVDPQRWVERLEQLDPSHPATKLLSFWKKAYGRQQDDDGIKKSTKRFYAMEQTKRVAPIMASVRPVHEAYFLKLWSWMKEQARQSMASKHS